MDVYICHAAQFEMRNAFTIAIIFKEHLFDNVFQKYFEQDLNSYLRSNLAIEKTVENVLVNNYDKAKKVGQKLRLDFESNIQEMRRKFEAYQEILLYVLDRAHILMLRGSVQRLESILCAMTYLVIIMEIQGIVIIINNILIQNTS